MSREQSPGYLKRAALAAIRGLESKVLHGVEWLSVNGKKVTIPDLIARFQGYVDKHQAVTDDDVQLRTDLQIRKKADPVVQKDLGDLKRALLPLLGEHSQDLHKFGFKPLKQRRKLTGKEKVSAAQKMRATRAARHTMGKRQKKAFKGTIGGAKTP